MTQGTIERNQNGASIGYRVVESIESVHLDPTPKHYTLWYHYLLQDNPELYQDFDRMLRNNCLTAEIASRLYEKYIRKHEEDALVQEIATSTRQLIEGMFAAMGSFSNHTEAYTENLGEFTEMLDTDHLKDSPLSAVMQTLAEKAKTLIDQGEGLNRQLEESRQEIQRLKRNLDDVQEETKKDPLTGVANRRAFDELMVETIAKARDEETPLSLLMVDIDHFKRFNDTFGHLLGDEVIKIVARILLNSVKGQDVVARYGGEEFAVILPETPIEGGMAIAEKIRYAIASKKLTRTDTGEDYGKLAVSIGVSTYHAGDTPTRMIERADQALYDAKHAGRNRVMQEKSAH